MRRVWLIVVFVAATTASIGLSDRASQLHLSRTFAASPPTDPGIRTGTIGAGGFFSTLTTPELTNANAASLQFQAQWSVTGHVSGQPLAGLGPRYNTNACSWCHSYPATGGSSPTTNSEVQMATLNGATGNAIPSANYYAPDNSDGQPFIRTNGPTRAAYQRSTGAELKLYTIVGMSDIGTALPNCTSSALPQPNFATLLGNNDISPHIPIPLFGIGLVEATSDATLRAAQDQSKMASFGVTYGRFNVDGTGTIAHAGWKGAAPSGNYFTSLAYAAEIGPSTELFPKKSDPVAACMANPMPEDRAPLDSRGNCGGCAMDWNSEVVNADFFQSHLAAPAPAGYTGAPPSNWRGSSATAYTTKTATFTQGAVYDGYQQFLNVGCDTCHVPSHTTSSSQITGTSNTVYYSYSDYALHTMGMALDDGLTQGAAGHQDYKTAALWGVGQRIWFLHDGRTNDLYQAIEAHCSVNSEAVAVCSAYNGLSTAEQQAILDFLRSL
jgi:CxxC motif-containing protein (DUF1111 family)